METTFPALADIAAQYMLIADMCELSYPLVSYKRLLYDDDELDEVHSEIPEEMKRWSLLVMVRMYPKTDAESHPMTRFGVEVVRDVLFQVCVPHMLAAKLAWQDPSTFEIILVAKAGDRILYANTQYEVLEARRGQTFANTDVPLYYELPCTKLRLDSTQFEGV